MTTCDAVLVMTGTDLAADFRGRYDNEDGARRVIERFTNGGTLEQVAEIQAARYEIREYYNQLNMVRRGDVMLRRDPERGPILAIVADGKAWIPTEHRLMGLPLGQCSRAWGI